MGNLDVLIGTRLKSLRQSRSISAASLAGHLGISELDVMALEQGRQHLQASQLLQVCELFTTSIEEFMQGI